MLFNSFITRYKKTPAISENNINSNISGLGTSTPQPQKINYRYIEIHFKYKTKVICLIRSNISVLEYLM